MPSTITSAVRRFVAEATQALVEVCRVVVFEAIGRCARQRGAVVNARVALCVEQQYGIAIGQRRDDPDVCLISGGEQHHRARAVEVGQLAFESGVIRIRAACETRSGGAGAETCGSFRRRAHAIGMECQARDSCWCRRAPPIDRLPFRSSGFRRPSTSVPSTSLSCHGNFSVATRRSMRFIASRPDVRVLSPCR